VPGPLKPTTTFALADPAYHAAFDVERARVLRQRTVVALAILLVLLLFSAIGSFAEYQEALQNERTPWIVFFLGVLYDVCVAALAIAMLGYVLTRKPDRKRLVVAITLWTVATVAVAIYFESRRGAMAPTDWVGDPVPNADPRIFACRWALAAFCLIVSLSLLLIPMRLRESRWIAAGSVLAFVAILPFVTGVAAPTTIAYTLLASLFAVAAMLFSHWRYQRFDANFEHRELKGRYGELSSEMASARRLHESLFPPPDQHGALHVGYVYEPMREIGGDFLFMPPRDPARAHDRATYIVLIDVSGHGIASALAVNRLHGELTRIFAAADNSPLSPGDVIAALNSYVYLTLAPQGVFATGICLHAEHQPGSKSPALRLRWASAGHPPAMLKSHSRGTNPAGGTVHQLGTTATMLGVLENELFTHGEQSIPIVPGDVIIAYTDGLIETREQSGRDFGIPAVERIVREWRGTPQHHDAPLAHALMNAALRHRGTGRVTDDTLIVEISVNAEQPNESPRRHAEPVTSSRGTSA
jgi:serine phosphatase RsbU (regulator of sigma subunit)